MAAPTVYTLGHSNHPWPRFVALLRDAGSGLVADVRSRPRSRYPWFNQLAMEAALPLERIGYRWLGARLGGRPTERNLLREDGTPDYPAMAAGKAFGEGIAELMALLAEGPAVALMCSEGDPVRCHREHLIAPALRARGIQVVHLLPDGERLLV